MPKAFSGRFPLILLIVGLLALLGIVVVSTMQLFRLKQQLAEREQTVATLTARNDELQQQLAAIEEERKSIESRLNEMRTQLSSATSEVTRLRTEMTSLQTRYESLSSEKTEIEGRATRLTQERNEAQEHARELDAEKQDLERASSRLRERFTLLDRDYQRLASQLASLEESRTSPVTSAAFSVGGASGMDAGAPMGSSIAPARPAASMAMSSASAAIDKTGQAGMDGQTVELPPIVVRKEQAGTGLPIRARLVEVNVGHRFMVIDKGSNDGVRVGMTFDVVRGGATVAQASVVRARPQLAACDLITSRSPETPQVGDLAIQRTP